MALLLREVLSLTTGILILVKCNFLLLGGGLESINKITALCLGHNILELEWTLAVSCGEVGRAQLLGKKPWAPVWVMLLPNYPDPSGMHFPGWLVIGFFASLASASIGRRVEGGGGKSQGPSFFASSKAAVDSPQCL